MLAETASLTFVGNATTIIRYGGVTLLTDPNFLRRGERAELGYGITSRRLKDPAISVDELPELDGVVLSHLHGDHWDPVAERYLDRGLPILTTAAAARALNSRGFRAAEGMRTWETESVAKGDHAIRITALPGRHAPGPLSRLLPPVMGSLLEFGPPDGEPRFRLCISGDTLMYDEIAEIRRRYPGIDAGVVHLGGTRLLGLLTVTGLVQLWHVYAFAFLFGCSAALDAPVRQTFVAELVGEADLSNAIALNSTSFNAARMIGPAVAGLVIASVGTGWAFLFNGASFMAVLTSLSLLRTSELRPNARAHRTKGSVLQGFHYVWSRLDLRATLIMLFLIGTFGLNFPIFISTMAVGVFHTDARGFGLLSSMMAIGTMSGALLAASREYPRFNSLLMGAAIFGLGCTLAALAPMQEAGREDRRLDRLERLEQQEHARDGG